MRLILVLLMAVSVSFAKTISQDQYILTAPKIVNGTEAVQENTKHQVAIHLKAQSWYFGSGVICGGSLIKPSVVLTAAHCFYNYQLQQMRTPEELFISMGALDRHDRVKSFVFEISELIYQPTFDPVNYTDDIAIVILNGQAPVNNKTIETISINNNNLTEGTLCQVTGWGVMNDGFMPAVLMTTNVPLINDAKCHSYYEGYIHDGMLCSGYLDSSTDACSGDSGGPLVCNGRLTGIVSFGDGCALPNKPGVYTDVKHYIKWVEANTRSSSEHLSSSTIVLLSTILMSLLCIN